MSDVPIVTNAPFSGDQIKDNPQVHDEGRDKEVILQSLRGYKQEAENARKGGLNPRDMKWEQNLNLYWNRVDFSKKATWQAKEVMPEVPGFVDRFAAAMKEALISVPQGFYTVQDPADKENDLGQAIKNVNDVWLSRSGRNQMGQLLPFSTTFEEQMKMGALMATSSVVTWKNDVKHGRVAIETTDPRFVWLDHTYRNLYRIRRVEIDLYDLKNMSAARDSKGKPLFNLPEIANLMSGLTMEDQARREQMSGSGQQITTGRQPIIIDEYIATVLDSQGKLLADKALMVVANDKYLIRGPETNPFWHKNDWLVYSPLVTAPLSVYGRSYMEDFGALATTFTELTNMILDAVHTSALKMYAIVPDMLMNPGQIAGGMAPNKMWLLEPGYRAEDFAKALDMGTLPAEAVKVWQLLKSELGEAAGMNEIGLGQFAPNSRTSATEVLETKQSSSALIRSLAQTIETGYLDPTLDLAWKTGLQHAEKNDPMLINAAGEEMWAALYARRKELIQRPITFQARGISAMIQRSQTMKALMGVISMISGNEMLTQEFMKKVDLSKLIGKLFELSGVDLTKLQASDREKMMAQVANPLQQLQQGAQGAPGAQGAVPSEMSGITKALGVGQ